MDGTYIEQQKIDSYHISDRAFYDKFCVNVIGTEDENTGFHEGILQVSLDVSTPGLQCELDREWEQLFKDHGIERYSSRLYDGKAENYPLEIAGKSDLELEWTLKTDGINLKKGNVH